MTTTTPTRQSSKARSPYAVQLERVAGGAYAALSSDGHTWYRVAPVEGVWQCTCAGFGYRGTCCHSLAAALPRCEWCLSTEQIARYVNPYELETPLLLCAPC